MNALTGVFYLDYYAKIIYTPSLSVTRQTIVSLKRENARLTTSVQCVFVEHCPAISPEKEAQEGHIKRRRPAIIPSTLKRFIRNKFKITFGE
jgi:hypothetical protein